MKLIKSIKNNSVNSKYKDINNTKFDIDKKLLNISSDALIDNTNLSTSHEYSKLFKKNNKNNKNKSKSKSKSKGKNGFLSYLTNFLKIKPHKYMQKIGIK
jgi:hypothetical protein